MSSPVTGTATDQAPPGLQRTPPSTGFMGHPPGLGLLFVAEMWERFSYYGMRALLVLYLVNSVGWGDARAANLYGTYTMLVYLTPLIGGYLADRLIGTRRSLVIGGVLIAAGHFTLAFPSMGMFYAGLGLVIIGTGFFKPNVSTMVGQLYEEGDQRRDSGFTIFYMGINVGAFLGAIICGWLGQKVGWHWGFGAAGVGMVLGLIVYLALREKYLPGIGLVPAKTGSAVEVPGSSVADVAKQGWVPGAAGAAIGVVLGWMVGGTLGVIMGAAIGASLAITILGSHGEERKRVIALFIVVFFVIFFWAAFEQAGSSMNLFADRQTDRVVAGWEVPSTWFQSVNPLLIIIFAAPFAMLWSKLGRVGKEPSTPLKMALGLFLLGSGFLFMVAGAKLADAGDLVSPFWLVAAYTFHTWGELCLSPVGLSYVTKVAPWQFASLLMGVWFLANAAANKIAGSLAAMLETIPSLTDFYTIFVVSSFAAGVVMLMLVPLLKRLTRTVKM
ncbi:MAG: peptide MFS transporter [Gemmatimonadaceae bacterium]